MKFAVYMAITLGISLVSWKLCFPGGGISAVPALERRWDEQVYCLDENEVIRFVPSSITFQQSPAFYRPFNLSARGAAHRGYIVEPQRVYQMGGATGRQSVHWAIRWCAKLDELDFELPEHLPGLPDSGDWFIRDDAPTQRRMQALQSLLSTIAKTEFIIENKLAEREVVIASGEWMLRAIDDDAELGFYTGRRSSAAMFTFGTLDDSFRALGQLLNRKIINQVSQPPSKNVAWRTGFFSNHNDDAAALDGRLAVLQKQTSLKFERARRQIPIWFIREKSLATQSVSTK